MIISKTEFTELVINFDFKTLFWNFGWENDNTQIPQLQIANELIIPRSIADKNGFKIIECETPTIPLYPIRIQITNTLKKVFQEHLLIFHDSFKTEQIWLYCYKLNENINKVEVRYNIKQDIERLYQRASGLIFELDEQDNITIMDVVDRVRENFASNAEKVTKHFYDLFKIQHTMLVDFIQGMQLLVDKEWYASIMLNRLMFCYFLQRRGFLNNDRNYLRNKLIESKKRLDIENFYSFYRSFLMVLFQKGFGTFEHTAEIIAMIGDIPYLDGSLFDLIAIERNNPDIDISDKAFENIFDFFDQYEWHLDTRDCATGNEINPNVLGYIFEKYINDRSKMGAYYTHEDITNYISRGAILPRLLENVKLSYPQVFEDNGIIWNFLQNSGDGYIFDSMKHGVDLPLPIHIFNGLDLAKPNLLERRAHWNQLAPQEFALPTEIWREVIERRTHYNFVKNTISSGGITKIADLIRYNLDAFNFIVDLLGTIEDPKFIQTFYINLEMITILDPTCGSGAFLFAALNILEPLYDICLSRMDDYLNHTDKILIERGIKRFFDEKLELMENKIHPSKRYFILKTIILNNLYGVDIMREAVETTKLRMFLKLVSSADPDYNRENIGIEPLPDIDFNIKTGNTLIGYASEAEVDNALEKDLFSNEMATDTKDAILKMAHATARYKRIQLFSNIYLSEDFKKAKEDLSFRQCNLKYTLDELLRNLEYSSVSNDDWMNYYIPFHWVSEFYSIIVERDGFDVIIGNPPYLETKQTNYVVNNFDTSDTKTIHANCVERSFKISNNNSCVSMIVPLSLVSTQRMKSLRNIIEKDKTVFYSNYSWRPGKLFDTVNRALTIFIALPDEQRQFCTGYMKWNSENRDQLFKTIVYNEPRFSILPSAPLYWIGKIGNELDNSILDKLFITNNKLFKYLSRNGSPIFYKATGGLYWKIFTNFAPKFFANGVEGHSSREKVFYVNDNDTAIRLVAILSSSLFWIWYTLTSNLRDLNPSDIFNFNLPSGWNGNNELVIVGKEYIQNICENSVMKKRNQRTVGETLVQTFKISSSKNIIDKIDALLAKRYGFSDEELDYIINFDIKYRMGLVSGAANEEDL